MTILRGQLIQFIELKERITLARYLSFHVSGNFNIGCNANTTIRHLDMLHLTLDTVIEIRQ